MLQKLFVKYARAVADEGERRALFRLYCAMFWTAAVFFALSAAVVIESFLLPEEAESGMPYLIFAVSGLLWLTMGVAALVTALVFRAEYKKILKRAPSAGEMPEIAAYRSKVQAGYSRRRKVTAPLVVLLLAGAAVMIALIIADVVLYPEAESLTALGYAGIVVFGLCALIFTLVWMFSEMKRSLNGDAAEMQTAEEARAIDAAQGRKHGYSLREDKNAQSYRYLFPDEELRREAEALRKRQQTAVMRVVFVLAVAVGAVLMAVMAIPSLDALFPQGFYIPVAFTLLFAAAIAVSLPALKKFGALEKRQKARLEEVPEYAVHLEIYRKYEAFSKFKGKAIWLFFAAALLLGYVLAAVFPDEVWSLTAVIPLLAGLWVNNALVASLRKEVLPLEAKIDRMEAERASAEEG